MYTVKMLIPLVILAAFTACSKDSTPGTGAPPATPAAVGHKAAADTALPEAAKLELVHGLLNRDLYIEMKARHNIITARILNDPALTPKMDYMKKEYNALCADYKVTLSDFNQYDSDVLDWGSDHPEAFSALNKRIEKRRQELLKTMPE